MDVSDPFVVMMIVTGGVSITVVGTILIVKGLREILKGDKD